MGRNTDEFLKFSFRDTDVTKHIFIMGVYMNRRVLLICLQELRDRFVTRLVTIFWVTLV